MRLQGRRTPPCKGEEDPQGAEENEDRESVSHAADEFGGKGRLEGMEILIASERYGFCFVVVLPPVWITKPPWRLSTPLAFVFYAGETFFLQF